MSPGLSHQVRPSAGSSDEFRRTPRLPSERRLPPLFGDPRCTLLQRSARPAAGIPDDAVLGTPILLSCHGQDEPRPWWIRKRSMGPDLCFGGSKSFAALREWHVYAVKNARVRRFNGHSGCARARRQVRNGPVPVRTLVRLARENITRRQRSVCIRPGRGHDGRRDRSESERQAPARRVYSTC